MALIRKALAQPHHLPERKISRVAGHLLAVLQLLRQTRPLLKEYERMCKAEEKTTHRPGKTLLAKLTLETLDALTPKDHNQ
jgi:hypothetical protein